MNVSEECIPTNPQKCMNPATLVMVMMTLITMNMDETRWARKNSVARNIASYKKG